MIPVGWLAPSECWDSNLLRLLVDGALYPHGLQVKHHAGYPNTDDGAAIVIPGRFWADHYDEISSAISRYDWVLAFRTSDEEDWFDPSQVEHPNIRWWVQTPRPGSAYPDGARFFGVGYPPHMNELPAPSKDLDVFLSAQRTHIRREAAFEALERSQHRKRVRATRGFSQGMKPVEYRDAMLRAKIAPCPSGAVSVDSFRVWEALEAGAVPIVDTVSPVDGETTYWGRLFTEPVPFPVYSGAAFLPSLIDEVLNDWPAVANRVQAFWMRYKRQLSIWLREDLEALGEL